MGNLDKRKLDIETTTVAIREAIMSYYKGTCVERMVDPNNIHIHPIEVNRRYQYEREISGIRSPSRLWIGNAPIMELWKNSNKVIYYDVVLKRSPELRIIRSKLTKFFREYLKDVKVEVQHGTIYDN